MARSLGTIYRSIAILSILDLIPRFAPNHVPPLLEPSLNVFAAWI